jgi:hypothetical protein
MDLNRTSQPIQPGETPPGYHQALYWRLGANPKFVIWVNVAGIPLLLGFGYLFFMAALRLGRLPMRSSFSLGIIDILLVLAGILLVVVLHELTHGLFMAAWGAHPKFGVIWSQGMFFATAPGFAFPRAAYLVISLAPLVFLSLLAVGAMSMQAGTNWPGLWALCATINASGAVGDMWMALIVLRYPAAAYVIDERDGMRVFIPD